MGQVHSEPRSEMKAFVPNFDLRRAERAGMIRKDHPLTILYSTAVFSVLFFGFITCFGQVVVKARDDNPDMMVLVESLHWVGVLLLAMTIMSGMWLGTKEYMYINDTIKAGFYSYSDGLSPQELQVLHKGNLESAKFNRVFFIIIFMGCFASMLRDPIFGGFIHEEGSEVTRLKFYNTWFPFAVNTWPKYAVVCTFQFFLGISVLFQINAILSITVSCLIHLSCSFELLQMKISKAHSHIKDLTENQKDFDDKLYCYLTECVQHHQALIRFYYSFQRGFSKTCLILYLNSGVIICAVGYILTGPDTNLRSAMAFLFVVATELFFFGGICFYGERIIYQSGKVHEVVYNTPWYKESKRVAFIYYMLMMRSLKPLTFTAFGLKSVTLSTRTFGDILQTSYSYFNMLLAARK